ncbi:MAG: ATP-binding protein [Clostridiales bacterium]|nr:ATP-binding protein [Clostridiales bacterium]
MLQEKMDRLEEALTFVCGFLEREGCPEHDRQYFEISVEELFTNVASYAYGPDGGMVRIDCWTQADPDGKEMMISLKDWGIPYNPFARANPDLSIPVEERPIGGLGVYMVKKFMDRTEYHCEAAANVVAIG